MWWMPSILQLFRPCCHRCWSKSETKGRLKHACAWTQSGSIDGVVNRAGLQTTRRRKKKKFYVSYSSNSMHWSNFSQLPWLTPFFSFEEVKKQRLEKFWFVLKGDSSCCKLLTRSEFFIDMWLSITSLENKHERTIYQSEWLLVTINKQIIKNTLPLYTKQNWRDCEKEMMKS